VRPPKNCVEQAIPIPEEGNLKKSVPPTLSWAYERGAPRPAHVEYINFECAPSAVAATDGQA
jgi:hypothetical protein